MIIWVDDRLFESGACDVDRLALLRGAAKRRHTMMISTDPRGTRLKAEAPAFARWKAGLPERLHREVNLIQDRLAIISTNATTRGAEWLLISAHEWPNVAGCHVTMEEAVRAVVLPTYVLVENAIHDRAFLRRAMPPAWRERLDQWERLGLLRYEQAGGNTEMLNIIECHAKDDYARQAFGLPSRLWGQVHVVVYDHDGDKAECPHANTKKLEVACNKVGLRNRNHRLWRRDQEHYLPREAMTAMVEKHFGNSSGDRDEHLAKIDAHFKKGDERHFAIISKEFFKNAFYNRPIDWKDEWFQADGTWPEMTVIAEMIATAI